MLTRVLATIGGNRLIVFWAFGELVQMACAVVLYLWLCRIARPAFSAVVVVATFIFASGDIADYPYFYHHLVVSYCLLGAWLSALACEAVNGRHRFFLALPGGALLDWACAVKETSGMTSLTAVLVITVIILWSRRDQKGLAVVLGGLTLGAIVPLTFMVLWLENTGVFWAFIEQAIAKGPSSKGGLAGSLARPIYLTWIHPQLRVAAALAIIILGLGILVYIRGREKPHATATRWYWLAAALAVPAIIVGRILTGFPPEVSRTPTLTLCYLSLSGCLLVSAALAFRLLMRRERINAHHPLLAGIGFSSAYALSMSWPAFKIMILPGVSYLLAATLQHVPGKGLASGLRVGIILCCLIIVVTVSWRKHMLPQIWGRWVEPPIAQSFVRSKLPELSGFVLSPITANFFQAVTAAITAHSGSVERIFVYPNMPVFYALAKRMPTTQGLSHWVDICPDYFAHADAQRLLANPPAVMVVHPDLPRELATEEYLFRGAQPSAVHEVLAMIEFLTPRYDLVATFPAPGHQVPVFIYSLKREYRTDVGSKRSR